MRVLVNGGDGGMGCASTFRDAGVERGGPDGGSGGHGGDVWLRASHNAAQTDPTKSEMKYYGMDCISGKVQNNLQAGILEPALSKVKMIQFATEAAITVLRIDDVIKLAPEDQGQGGMPGMM